MIKLFADYLPSPQNIKRLWKAIKEISDASEASELPKGANRQVAIFDSPGSTLGKLIAGLFRPNHWSQILKGAPTESGTYVAAFTNNPVNPEEDMFFIKTTLIPEFGAVPVYDVNGQLFTYNPTDANHAVNKGYIDSIVSAQTGTINALIARVAALEAAQA